jgi:hypothetical protein
MLVEVNNINGMSQNTRKCGSWLGHWKKYSRQAPSKWCSESGCIKAPEVGAHLRKDSFTDEGWYIVPFCNDTIGRRASF